MNDLQDPELKRYLDGMVDEGPVYQAVSPDSRYVRYILAKGRHYHGVMVDTEERTWSKFNGGPAKGVEWLVNASAVTVIEEWGDE